MHKFLKLLSFSFVFILSTNILAGNPNKNFWFCKQIGHQQKQKTMYTSHLMSHKVFLNFKKSEKTFEKLVQQKSNKQFMPVFPVQCYDFFTKKQAIEFKKEESDFAIKNEYKIIDIPFTWSIDNE